MHDLRPDKVRWLDEAIAQIPVELTADVDGETHRHVVDSYLRPRLKRCNSKSKKTFWQWFRLQLAKSEETSKYLLWCRESKCPLEVVKPTEGFQYSVNGDVALIDVGSPEHPAVWQVPADKLPWALSLYPARLKELPPTESPVTREIRLLRRRLARDSWRMTTEQKDSIIRQLNDLELVRLREYAPTPRFFLTKSVDGVDVPVHRIYVDAGTFDEVDAIDGDYLNFTTTTVRVTVELVSSGGLAVRKGDKPPVTVEEMTVHNLRVINSVTKQHDFEDTMTQYREQAHARADVSSSGQWIPAKPIRPSGASGTDDAKNSEQAAWDKSQKG